MKNIITALFLIFIMSFSTPANAKFMFGDKQDVRKLVDVNLKGKENESLYLGYLVKTKFFGLGVYVQDGGYVLGVSSDKAKYYPLPAPEVIEQMKQSNLLPKNMPEYKLSIMDYVFGLSLYLAIAAIVLHSFISRKLKRRKLRL